MLYKLIRPLLFAFAPERAHHLAVSTLRTSLCVPGARSLVRSIFRVNDPSLGIERFGIHFPNPVGLAAGFDKSGEAFNALGALGFGFVEIGTITALAQLGNPQPRMFRLRKDRALLNRMGFNNPGAIAVADRLGKNRIEPILGINIGKSKATELENANEDYLKSLEILEPFASYFAANVSSPNTPGLRSLQEAEPLSELLGAIQSKAASLAEIRGGAPRPILLKIAPDLSDDQLDSIVQVALSSGVSGIIACNTTVSREGLTTEAQIVESLGSGGISGAPVRERAIQIVERIYRQTSGKLPIVGVGGIFSAQDAWRMIVAGASLVQIYTGFIYQGPSVVRQINLGLLRLLRQHGLHSLDKAVGLSHRQKEFSEP